MILSDTEIKRALTDGRIIINPPPSSGDPKAYDTTAVNLHISNELLIPKSKKELSGLPIDYGCADIKDILRILYEQETIEKDYILEPGQFILGQTVETIELPAIPDERDGTYLAARVEGKSSLARLGLTVHFTAPTIHAFFKGKITLEIVNLGNGRVMLRPGMAFCQLIFEKVAGQPKAPLSQFQAQQTPGGR